MRLFSEFLLQLNEHVVRARMSRRVRIRWTAVRHQDRAAGVAVDREQQLLVAGDVQRVRGDRHVSLLCLHRVVVPFLLLLRCQLAGRQFVQDAAAWLGRQPQLGHDVFGRGTVVSAPAARETDTTALLRACLLLLRVPEDESAIAPPRPVFWTVANAIMQIRTQLAGHPDGLSFVACLPLLLPAPGDQALRCRAAVASTFVAVLELARVGALQADQTGDVLRLRPVPLAELT